MQPNPFDVSDDEGSSDGNITKIFETDNKNDGEDIFDFDSWIIDNNLNDIKQCFIDYSMINLETLKLTNPNFAKLTGDKRVLEKPLLFQHIVNGIQSLELIRNKQNKNDGNDDDVKKKKKKKNNQQKKKKNMKEQCQKQQPNLFNHKKD